MKQYKEDLQYILDNGIEKDDRTGVGTISVFGLQTRYDLSKGFPAVTAKKLAWNAVVGELLWFLEGSVDERRLAELTFGKHRDELKDKRTIWTDNANHQGTGLHYTQSTEKALLGPVYGAQWRGFNSKVNGDGSIVKSGKDQIADILYDLKHNKDSRRIILSAWNPNSIDDMALPPCHVMSQFMVQGNKLSCQLYQRSCDMGLGHNFNVASYALLTHMLAEASDLEVGEFIHTIGDAHIYKNHIDAVKEIIDRESFKLPTLSIIDFNLNNYIKKPFEINTKDKFKLIDYSHGDPIKMKMAI